MVSTGLSEVIGSWKIMAISLPRIWRISSSSSSSRFWPSEDDLARDDLARRLGDQAHERQGGHALAAAALAHDAERLFLVQIERDIVDRFDHPVLGEKLGLEVFDLEQWSWHSVMIVLSGADA